MKYFNKIKQGIKCEAEVDLFHQNWSMNSYSYGTPFNAMHQVKISVDGPCISKKNKHD